MCGCQMHLLPDPQPVRHALDFVGSSWDAQAIGKRWSQVATISNPVPCQILNLTSISGSVFAYDIDFIESTPSMVALLCL